MKLTMALVGAALLVPGLASADETAAPAVHTTPVVTIIGRVARPSVVIELTRPTAAREAGAAHESMRARLVTK